MKNPFYIKCICGKTEMTFYNLTEKDFPSGFTTDCCPTRTPPKRPQIYQQRTSVHDWLDDRELLKSESPQMWVKSTVLYKNYVSWMNGLKTSPLSQCAFGRVMVGLFERKRRKNGYHYRIFWADDNQRVHPEKPKNVATRTA